MLWCSLFASASGGYIGGETLGKWSENKDRESYKINYKKQYIAQ